MTTHDGSRPLVSGGCHPDHPTHLEQPVNHTDTTAETARALLYRHGLPEDVIDGVLCLHAQELAEQIRDYADDRFDVGVHNQWHEGAHDAADQIAPTDQPAASAVVSPPTSRAAVLREAADHLAAMDPVEAALAGQHAWVDAANALRRLAAEAQQQPDTETRPTLRERHRAAWNALTPAEQDARLAALDADESAQPDTETPTARPTRYVVNLLPEDAAPDAHIFEITVEWRGDDRWAVLRHGRCLGSDGDWDYELRPSEREDDWLDAHRFDLDTALRLAKEQAPLVNVNGITAAEALKRHRADAPRP